MGVDINQVVKQGIGFFLAFALALFLPAGTLAWPAGWIFLGLFYGFYIGVTAWLFRHNPGLLQERMQLGSSDQKGWDKVLFPLLLTFPLVWFMVMAADAVCYHWSPLPGWLQVGGALVLLGSFYLLFLTFRENTYLSTVVRIQADRGHTVVSTGPYHYVRHPMYTGMLAFMIGTPLLLGAWYGIFGSLLFMLILARRAVLEERTLRQELRGYRAYMEQVNYRLIPYLW